ncbi:MAG: hypothetical protein IID49_07670 [Proteobacteria bacterium]|nr:hypothetical protein [Pseudomonadota bacterium]
MKMTLTAAAALIGLAAAFGPAGTAPAMSLPDGTPVIEAGGGHRSGGHRSGQRRGGRNFGHRGGGSRFGRHGGGSRFGRHGGGHGGHGHGHGHGYYRPYVYGGIALGTYLFLDALDHY